MLWKGKRDARPEMNTFVQADITNTAAKLSQLPLGRRDALPGTVQLAFG